jgi:hypothetical protein
MALVSLATVLIIDGSPQKMKTKRVVILAVLRTARMTT